MKDDHFWVLQANAQFPSHHLEGKARMIHPPEPRKIQKDFINNML